jgi:hypothetical protein
LFSGFAPLPDVILRIDHRTNAFVRFDLRCRLEEYRAIERSKKMRLRGSLTLLMAALPCLLWGCDRVSTDRVLARVLETNGEAVVVAESSQPQRTRRPLRAGMLISPGETIETGENASATISLLPGMVLRVNSNAMIGIDKLILVKGGRADSFLMESREAQIQLTRGSLSTVTVETYVPTELHVATSAGVVIALQKTSLYLRATTETVRLTNSEGTVSFRARTGSEPAALDAGYFEDWVAASGAPLAEPRPTETDPEAFQQTKETQELEDKMPGLLEQTIDPRRG